MSTERAIPTGVLIRVCSWCDTVMGTKPAHVDGVTHGMCAGCLKEHLEPQRVALRQARQRSAGA